MSTTTSAPTDIARDDFVEKCADISFTGSSVFLTIQRNVEESNTTEVELDSLFLNSWDYTCYMSGDLQIDPRNYEATAYFDAARTNTFAGAFVDITTGNLTVSDIDPSYNDQDLTIYVVMYNSHIGFDESGAILIEISDSTPYVTSSGSLLPDIDQYWGETTATDLTGNFTDPIGRAFTYSLATDDGKLIFSRYELYYRVNQTRLNLHGWK